MLQHWTQFLLRRGEIVGECWGTQKPNYDLVLMIFTHDLVLGNKRMGCRRCKKQGGKKAVRNGLVQASDVLA